MQSITMPRTVRDPVNDFVRKRIRMLRLNKNLTTGQLAALSGIPEGSYCCLESGHSRISIANLQRITKALETGIHEVWPQPTQALEPPASTQTEVPDREQLRFREICSLTEARSAALLSSQTGRPLVLFESNLARKDRELLLRRFQQGKGPAEGWHFYDKHREGRTVRLALQHPTLAGRLGLLTELYINLWLSTSKDEGIRSQESGIRKNRRPKVGGI